MTDPGRREPARETDGQTARDAALELGDDGIPDVQDGTPQQAWAEDPEFAPIPGERPTATLDHGTTAFEQSQGEPLTQRLEREVPDDADVVGGVRTAEDPNRAGLQLEQDTDTTFDTDSGTQKTADDVEGTADAPVGGEGPEEGAVHRIEP